MDNNITEQFGLNTPIKGMDAITYMASLIESNEKMELEIERGKLSVSILKQMNNRSRLLIDAAKYELKRKEAEYLEKAKAEA